MKIQSCFMVRCILQSSNPDDSENILLLLKKIINKQWPKATIILKTNEAYWKWQGYREFIYNVSNLDFIFVKEVMTSFDVKWKYLKNEVFNIDINKAYDSEELIWNKINYPSEIFLKPEIEWVHIYTWLE